MRLRDFRLSLPSLGLIVLSAACSSGPKTTPNDPPQWTRQPTRTIDGGYIVYVGSGEDRSPDQARFKAEAMALQDLSNECSFAPKGTRIEDRFSESEGVLYRSFAKVAVEYQDCETAKNAVTPEDIRTLANASLTEEVKRYQDKVDNPEDVESAPLTVASNESSSPSSSPSRSTSGATVAGINSPVQFYVIRQQVLFVKQDVILAPPAQYPPGAPATTQPIQTVAMASQSVRQYEQANPQLRTTPASFSKGRPNWSNHQASVLRFSKQERSRIQQTYAKPQTQEKSSSEKPRSGHKKSRRHRRDNAEGGNQ